MGYYLAFDDFYSQVKKEFSFLLAEKFVEKTFEKGRTYRLYYSKELLTICIEYSITNDFLEITFSRENEKGNPNQSSINNTLDLTQYFGAKGYNHQFYLALMPKVIGFEASVKGVSYIVKNLAIDLIRSEEWVTNKMIIEGFRY